MKHGKYGENNRDVGGEQQILVNVDYALYSIMVGITTK